MANTEMDAVIKSIDGLRKAVEGLAKEVEGQGVIVAKVPEIAAKLTSVEEIAIKAAQKYDEVVNTVEEVSKTARVRKTSQLFGGQGNKGAKHVKDRKTGISYWSLGQAGIGVAAEFGLDPTDTMAWYKIPKEERARFVTPSDAEIAKLEADHKAEQERVQAESQAKIDAEAGKTPAAK